jgi:cytoskeletal protein RodZ
MDVAEAGRLVILSDTSSGTPSDTPETKVNGGRDERSGLGAYLVSARERRGISRADAIAETRIPDHYVRMMESNDYSMISDQLYVMPFLRRYAAFLALDPDEVIMRFVREVQRADTAPSPRSLKPIEMTRPRKHNWAGLALVAGLLAVMVFAWLAEARHHRLAVGGASGSPVSERRTTSG